jgi:glycosyltransferase involved in cell wall biosynthesis
LKLIQPFPNHEVDERFIPPNRISSSRPVCYLRYRYPHHAAASGYDRICDYVESETVYPSKFLYLLGETALRPLALAVSRFGGHFEYSRYDWVAERAFESKIRQAQDSIFHVIYAEKSLRTAHHLANRRGNRLVATVHHPKEHHKMLFKNFDHFRSAAAIIVMTSALRETWAEILGSEKVHYIPHGIDTNYFKPGHRDGTRRRCLFSGYHGRDFELLQQAARVLSDRYADFELWVVSSSPEALALHGITENVRVIRHLDDIQYLDVLKNFDLMILPVKADTANNAILEAMACGLPIVTNEGSPTDYMDTTCGHILPFRDAEGLIDACIDLLDDPGLRSRFGIAARQRAELFSWQRIAEKTVKLYETLH